MRFGPRCGVFLRVIWLISLLVFSFWMLCFSDEVRYKRGRGSSVGRARDSWSGGRGFDPRCGRPLPTGWVGVSIMLPAEIEVMVSQLYLMCGST